MPLHSRLSRSLVIAVAAAGFAVSGGTALADPSQNALQNRSDNAQANSPGTDKSNNGQSDDHQPAGGGTGRKIG
jgi:hypothetical protein